MALKIKVVNAFRSSLYEGLEKPQTRSAIHCFMTHPEFMPQESRPDPQLTDSDSEGEESQGLLKGLTVQMHNHNNNSSADPRPLDITVSPSESPVHSMETSPFNTRMKAPFSRDCG
ncbi:unnamed protein product [Ranitomeya imitator]|uniref:Plasma membrane calcium transporting P-type ATPase C-terminal domain-containing protein n=1 Tax=Ranitomeya imitator TaxID=111125 RepID=A0ABN9LJ18_9NEOB|nr:unnamed protein product [Ranitomeya imitator]